MMGSGQKYIHFEDSALEQVCIENWSSDGIGLTYADAAAVTKDRFNDSIINNQVLKGSLATFDEFKYFVGVIDNGLLTSYSKFTDFVSLRK